MKKICDVSLLVLSLFSLSMWTYAGEDRIQERSCFSKIAKWIPFLGVVLVSLRDMSFQSDYLGSMDPRVQLKTEEYIRKICPESSRSLCDSISLGKLAYTSELASLTLPTGVYLREDIEVYSPWDQDTGEHRFYVAQALAHSLEYGFFTSLFTNAQYKAVDLELKTLKVMEEGDTEAFDLFLRYQSYYQALEPIGSFLYLTPRERLLLWSWYKQEKDESNFNYSQFVNRYIQDREIVQTELEKVPFSFNTEKQQEKINKLKFSASYKEIIFDQKKEFEKHLAKDTSRVVEAYKKRKQANTKRKGLIS